MSNYTTIDHNIRRKFNLTLNEYAICDSIYYLSRKNTCNASKDYLAEFIGVSRQTVHTIIKKLKNKGLISGNYSNLITTELWDNEILGIHTVKKLDTECKETLQGSVKKLDTECKETLQGSVKKLDTECKETLHNNNNINTINSNIYILQETIEFWNSKDNLTTHQFIIVQKYISKSNIKLLEHYGIDNIKNAINNYSDILKHPEKYFWSYKWSLWEFINRGMYKFLPEAEPKKNFLRRDHQEPKPEESTADRMKRLEERYKGAQA